VKYRSEYGVVEGWEKWLLDMVAIALVADMMPLVGENRKLVTFGLKVLQKSPRPAIQKICALTKVNQKELNEKDIAFTFAPRINAAGRMDHPILAYKMLADIEGKGLEYVEIIEDLNNKRKQSVKDINSFVRDMVLTDGDGPVLVGSKDWPIGVVGLVAQKIVEDTGRTALVWGMEGDTARGSVRSGVLNHNVVNLLTACKDALLHFGGHEQAGGFSLKESNLELLQDLLTKNSEAAVMKQGKSNKTEYIDISIFVKDINQKTFNKLREFAPFGIGNAEPRLMLAEKVINTKRFGAEKQHLELSIDGVPSVLFNVTRETEDQLKSRESFVGNIEYDNWRKRYQFKIHL
jgi:single-stranded-DNA-specific exonuclease